MIKTFNEKSEFHPIQKIDEKRYRISWDFTEVPNPIYAELTPEEQEKEAAGEYVERTIIGYDESDVATWMTETLREQPTIAFIKKIIFNWYDAQTDAKILNGYQWTVLHGADAGKVANVWLSMENQQNYKAYHDTAKDYPQLTTYPVKYKVGENPDKTAIYEEFANFDELAQFYLGGVNFIKQTVEEGWAKKDSIDWSQYEYQEPESEIVD